MIIAPDRKPLDDNGVMTTRTELWFQDVTDMQILSGTGTPETNVEAPEKTLYMDDAGTAGAILYIKRDADIGGDKSRGWILV